MAVTGNGGVAGEAAPPPTAEERQQVQGLREAIGRRLHEIPATLDTDLNLTRWIRGHGLGGGFEPIAEHFANYVRSRAAAHFDVPDLPEKFFDLPHLAPVLKHIASSRLGDAIFSEQLNAFVFVERAWAQPKEFLKTMKTSDYMLHCFGYSEMLMQLILRRERLQDPSRGPAQFIVIFDLATVNIADYLNPLSGHMQLWQLRSQLWQEWFPEMVQRIVLVHPPRLMSAVWKIAQLFLNERNYRLMRVVGDLRELSQHLPASMTPKEYGGELVHSPKSDAPWWQREADASGVSVRKAKITAQDHYRTGEHYRTRKVERARPSAKTLSPGEEISIPVLVGADQSMLWDFSVNGAVLFSIRRQDSDVLEYPLLRLATAKVPEEGVLENGNGEGGPVLLVFRNPSAYFHLKLDYSITLCRRTPALS